MNFFFVLVLAGAALFGGALGGGSGAFRLGGGGDLDGIGSFSFLLFRTLKPRRYNPIGQVHMVITYISVVTLPLSVTRVLIGEPAVLLGHKLYRRTYLV